MAPPSPSHLHGIVDMGSNGIRFSISDLSPPTARSLPTVFQSRLGVSLYDAQYSNPSNPHLRIPIPQSTIDSVVEALLRFKITCSDFGVPESNIQVLATEATRTAINSVEFRDQIREATGWRVQMLAKEMEGRIGAMGVASSFQGVQGLVMDLGGGSTQLTWLSSHAGTIQTDPQGSISFPYGAAALMRQLSYLKSHDPGGSAAHASLASEMQTSFRAAYASLSIPSALQTSAAQNGGYTLYLSGGGFRGWGYLLMSQAQPNPYPIPLINGFRVSKSDFQSVTRIQEIAAQSSSSSSADKHGEESIFRVSKRRAAQVPAVAFLVNVLCLAIPEIAEIRFCQGGVREGVLFQSLDAETRALDPLSAASAKLGSASAGEIADLLADALPLNNNNSSSSSSSSNKGNHNRSGKQELEHTSLAKESASLAALYAPLTGVLASAHAVSHPQRAMLALMLCQRWSGELAPPHGSLRDRLRQLLGRDEVWWCSYLGSVAALVADVYPAGRVERGRERVAFNASWGAGMGKKGVDEGVRLAVCTREGGM
ncbi:hypothetical protein EPUS_07190 [Endocarpon pusillum Z07020]|uniref:Uncharacterized protein n=1 Tax=Endocarpon pusillum (strain Z07020 / HMAS-L-300199) TaxID=1263415 RepID=U1HIE0_ENDPU|nr:uncharacterized protein EPUS_07190 [Endocarpon pusillum Z07020]ERF68629.1 hypothetical protein EPUS_07190 [Endocarpon pusillum Z07020]